jgi:hypothetical protein
MSSNYEGVKEGLEMIVNYYYHGIYSDYLKDSGDNQNQFLYNLNEVQINIKEILNHVEKMS